MRESPYEQQEGKALPIVSDLHAFVHQVQRQHCSDQQIVRRETARQDRPNQREQAHHDYQLGRPHVSIALEFALGKGGDLEYLLAGANLLHRLDIVDYIIDDRQGREIAAPSQLPLLQ